MTPTQRFYDDFPLSDFAESSENKQQKVREFLLAELSFQKQELVKRLEGMKLIEPTKRIVEGMGNIVRTAKIIGYNEALSDAIDIIKQ